MRKLAPALLISLTLVLSSGCLQLMEEEVTRGDEMRSLVQKVSSYARDTDEDFIVIVANGEDLASDGGRTPRGYLDAIDGVAREDLYFGTSGMDRPTPWSRTETLAASLNVSRRAGKVAMAVDRCSRPGFIWDSMEWANMMGFLYFASDSEGMDTIPDYPADPPGAHRGDVSSLEDARNLLVLTVAAGWDSRDEYLASLRDTNYDLLVVDAFFNGTPLKAQEVDSLRTKKEGGARLVVAVMGLGEIDERQHVWRDLYTNQPPGWLGKEVNGEPGKHRVEYWERGWRAVLFRSEQSWLDQILASGFDGVYLLGGDAHLFS
jgi:cysteinyl-tRNA synthetase